MNPERLRRNPLSLLISALALSLFTLTALLLAYRATAQAADSTLYLPLAVSNRTFDVTPVGRGFYVAMGITHAGDERIFVAERGGRIQLLQPDGRETTFLDLSAKVISSPGEYGLYDIAFHPGYADPTSPGYGFFYVFYNGREQGSIYSYISRFRVSADPDVADPAGETWLLRVEQLQLWHKGGELDFDPATNLLYASLGDDASPPNAQSLDTPKGKIIRLAVDDVPAAATGDATALVEPEFIVMGVRNPYRFDYDPATSRLFIGDVGENTWEEISVVAADGSLPNLGWPCREGPAPLPLYQNHPVCAGNQTFVEPATWLAHADGYCAIVAGKLYRPAHGIEQFIFTDLCTRDIFSLAENGDGWSRTRLGTADVPGMVTTIGEDVHGNLYIGTTGSNSPIFRLILR